MDKVTKSSKASGPGGTLSQREIKAEKVEALREKASRAKSITFVNYHGLGANQVAVLRAKIKVAGGEFLVEKNTLVKKALQANQLTLESEMLTGPTATIFSYEDDIAPIKEIATVNKELGFPTFKFGYLGHDLLDASSLQNLASLPSKDQLRAKVVGSLASPIYGFVNVLSANIRNLISVLDQAAQKSTA